MMKFRTEIITAIRIIVNTKYTISIFTEINKSPIILNQLFVIYLIK